jgi:hypothetical protein
MPRSRQSEKLDAARELSAPIAVFLIEVRKGSEERARTNIPCRKPPEREPENGEQTDRVPDALIMTGRELYE